MSAKKNISYKLFFKKKVILFSITSAILLLLSSLIFIILNSQWENNLIYKIPGVGYSGVTVITQKKQLYFNKTTELLAKKVISGNFIAQTNNLGIIAIPFNTKDKKINDKIIFRLKQINKNEWYYQRTYKADQIQNNAPFPFGFPIIKNSKDISYAFEVESLNGVPNNSLSVDKENYFYIKYKFSKNELINNPLLFLQFFILKINNELQFFTTLEIILVLLLGFSPFIIYHRKMIRNKSKPARIFFMSSMLKFSNSLKRLGKIYWLIPIFIILIYNLIFFNKYYPITEGWFSTWAWLFHQGQFPYRDFYFILPPFFLILMNIFTAIFGYSILYLRIFGILVILLMTYFLYKNIEIIFGAVIASFVTIVGIIYYQSGSTHIGYDFLHFLTLFGLIQSYFLLKYVNTPRSETHSRIKWVFWAGLFTGLAFLTKQSNGAMITAFSFAGLLLLSSSKGLKEVSKTSLSYICGFAVPVLLISLWLYVNSAFPQFVQQVFLGGASAKGGLGAILFAWITRDLLTNNFIARFTEVSLIVLILGYWLNFFTRIKEKNKNINRVFLFIASIMLLLGVLLPLFLNKVSVNELSILGQKSFRSGSINDVVVAGFSISIIVILTAATLFIFKKPFNKSIFLFSFVSLGFIYGTGTSAGISEAGAFVGFCLFIALMLQKRSILGLGKIFTVLFCISLCFMLVEMKYERPYYWWNVTSSDIKGKLQATNKISILQGIYTSADNIRLIEEVSAEIRAGSKHGEPVLTFPHIPIFYLLTDRRPPGKAIIYWFDFLSDELAIKEAEVIKKHPPKVIVYFDVGELVWKTLESGFRDGKPSGQRKVKDAIMNTVKSEKMRVSKKYKLPNDATLTVWRK